MKNTTKTRWILCAVLAAVVVAVAVSVYLFSVTSAPR